MDWNKVDLIVRCETISEANRFLTLFGEKARMLNTWYINKEQSCFHIHDGVISYDSYNFYKRYYSNKCTILLFERFLRKYNGELPQCMLDPSKRYKIKGLSNIRRYIYKANCKFC